MSKIQLPIPSDDSFMYLLLTLLALCGENPVALVSRLPGSES